MFQNLEQYRACLSVNACKSMPVYSGLLSELVLFLFDTVSVAAAYKAV